MSKNGWGHNKRHIRDNRPVRVTVKIIDMIAASASVKITTSGKDEHYMPLAQCSFHDNDDGTHTMTCPAWMAKAKDLIK